jgi:hypothetical protein
VKADQGWHMEAGRGDTLKLPEGDASRPGGVTTVSGSGGPMASGSEVGWEAQGRWLYRNFF